MIVDHFARKHGLSFSHRQGRAKVAEGIVNGHSVILAKPQTYMNSSGISVQGLVHRYKLPFSEIIVICDDMDLPLGKIRIRPGGSSGGHKGLQSVIDSLSTRDFARLRVGIGRPDAFVNEDGVVHYVLSEFKPEERPVIDKAIDSAVEALLCVLQESLSDAMNKFNR